MSNISLNYAQIIDPLSFKSINLAKIYIGEYGTLPNPANASTWKQAYFVNSDGTRTAASQPIRTNAAGFAVDGSGNIKTIQVDGGYSILVQDQLNVTKFSQACSPSNDGAVLEFDTIAGFSGALDGSVIFFKGRDTVGDGGGGMFRYSASSTATADGGTVFAPAGGGRLIRDILVKGTARVKWFGAKGDGATDDYAAVQSAIAYLTSIGGGYLMFDSGTYKLSQQITISAKGIKLKGTGKRGVYPGVFSATENTVATLMPVHSDRNMIRFYSTTVNTVNGFEFESMAAATLESGSMPTAAFGWDCTGTGAFQRDFSFSNSSVHGFTSAFDVYGAGSNNQMGLFKTDNCNINRNSWIARTLDGTQWNGFSFTRNEAGQNGYGVGTGGINVQAHSAKVSNNCLEGMRDPVRIFGFVRGVTVDENYFEANVGRACVELSGVRGPFVVGPNTYLAIDDSQLANKALASNVGMGTWNDTVWIDGAYKNSISPYGADGGLGDNVLNSQNSTTIYGLFRTDAPSAEFTKYPIYTAKQSLQVSSSIVREISPVDGKAIAASEYTTSGSGVIAKTFTLAGSSGQYVVYSAMVKIIPDAGADPVPYVSMLVNGAAGNGGRDYQIPNLSSYWIAGDWFLLTCAIKLTGAMTSLTVNLFPFGVNPSAGRVARYAAPSVYVTNLPTTATPYIDSFAVNSQPSAPPTGSWQVGDRIANSNPAAGGQSDFLYISTGWVYG